MDRLIIPGVQSAAEFNSTRGKLPGPCILKIDKLIFPGVEPAALFDSTRGNLPGPAIVRIDRLIAAGVQEWILRLNLIQYGKTSQVQT